MKYLSIIMVMLLLGCAKEAGEDPIAYALESESPKIQTVLKNLEAHEVQIKLSTISTNNDSIVFEDFEFQVNDSNYFYPASTVKFPVSILTLEKLQQDEQFNLDSAFFVEGDSSATTFRHEIRDIFAISSNDTFNRLFEFLGKDYINSQLQSKGLNPLRFSHRLSTTDADNLTTKPLIFLEGDSTLVSTEPIINKPIEPLSLERVIKGIGYYSEEELINEAMDFSEKNYLPVNTIHEMMKRLFFPNNYHPDQQFNLNDQDRKFLIETMAIFPKDAGYISEDYYDSYGKFFIYGDSKEPVPDHIKIHNKVGYAYGYLTDCAFINDTKNDLQYILTATIHVNANGIFNDDIYEYDEIGLPFLAQLGREIHAYLISNAN